MSSQGLEVCLSLVLIVGLRLHGACVMPGSPAVSAVRGLLTPERWRDPEPCGPLELETGLLCCMLSHSVMSSSLRLMDCSPSGSSVHRDPPGKNTGVGCHALLQGIFPTQRSSPGLPHCRQILYHLSHEGSPRILEWVAYPFSRGSS